MKWYNSLLIACGIALFAPQIASAKPIPAAAANNHGIAGAKPAPAPVARPAAPKPVMPAPAARPAPPAPPAIAVRPPAPPKPMAPAPMPPKPGHIAPPPAPPARNLGMNSRDFGKILDSIDRERSSSKKLRKARKALDSKLTSAQVKDILLRLTFDSDRVDFACDAYRNVVDRKNWSSVLSALDFRSNRDKVMACSR